MSKRKTAKGLKSKLFQAFVVILVIVVALFGANVYHKYQHRQAVNTVKNLYLGKDYVYIDPSITKEDINKAYQKIQQVEDSNEREKLSELVDDAKDKRSLLQELQAIYQDSKDSLITPEKTNEAPIFKPDVDLKKVSELSVDNKWHHPDAMTQALDKMIKQAANEASQIQELNKREYHIVLKPILNDFDAQQNLRLVDDIINHVEPVKRHPQVEDLNKKLDADINQFTGSLLVSYEAKQLSEQTLLQIKETPAFMPYLADTELDFRPKIALTFDDGPNDEFTPQVLDILDQYHIKAVFFVVGRNVEANPKMAKEIVKRGHTIANHSYSHPDLSKLSDKDVQEEINRTQNIIKEVTKETPTLFRMPYGAGGKRVVDMFPKLTSVMWNVDSKDWQLRNGKLIYDEINKQLSDDMLLLMHDTNQGSVDALAKLIPELIDKHYRFVSPEELEFKMTHF